LFAERMVGRGLKATAAVLALVAACGWARADEDDAARARALSNQGLAEYRQGRYTDAIRSFEASYAIAPLPALVFDMAQAYRLLGRCPEALQLYRRYLAEAGDVPNRGAVEARVAELETCARAAEPRAPAVADPDAARPSTSGASAASATNANANAPNADAANANAANANAANSNAVSAARSGPAARPVYQRWWLWATVGGVAAAAVITGVAVAMTRPVTFQTNLPETGPGVHTLGATVRF
jgi:tetratricopeptide (TPR) repeat protein